MLCHAMLCSQVGDSGRIAVPDKESAAAEPAAAPAARKAAAPAPAAAAATAAASAAAAAAEEKRKAAVEEAKKKMQQEQVRGGAWGACGGVFFWGGERGRVLLRMGRGREIRRLRGCVQYIEDSGCAMEMMQQGLVRRWCLCLALGRTFWRGVCMGCEGG